MSRPRTRVVVFVGVLAIATALVQWSGLSSLLDDTLGIPWSKGIVSFLKTNTQGLVLLALITLFYEFIGFESSREDTRERQRALFDLLDAALLSAPNSALIQYSLRREHDDPTAGALSRYLLSDRALLRDFSVSVRVEPYQDQFKVTITMQYKASLDRYIVALTSDSLAVEPLTVARAVTETFVVPAELAEVVPNVVGSVVEISAVTINDVNDAGSRDNLTFRPISDRKRRKVLRDAGISQDIRACRLYVAHPLRDLRLPDRPTELQYGVRFSTMRSRGHTFWSSDRPLHVRSIEVDLSALTPRQIADAEVHLFVGTVGWAPSVEGNAGYWLFPLDRWIVAGQGVVIVWPER